jgi:hypothetical protein
MIMNTEIRKLKGYTQRVETGPVQFGDDWPGLFIRGDNCIYLGVVLEELLHNDKTLPTAHSIYLKQLHQIIKDGVLVKPLKVTINE